MKKLLLILFTVVSVSVQAQHGWIKPNNSKGTISNGLSVDTALFIPTGCGAPTKVMDLPKSALYGDSCNNILYKYNPKDSSWTEIGNASDSNAYRSSVQLTDTSYKANKTKGGTVYLFEGGVGSGDGITQTQLNDTAQAIRSSHIIQSGTYLPTYWGLSNMSFPGQGDDGRFFYSRVDSIVTVSGFFTSVPSTNAITTVTFSLPIPSNFTQHSDVAGSVGGGFTTLVGGLVEADFGNDGISIVVGANGTGGGRTWSFTCQYIIK